MIINIMILMIYGNHYDYLLE